MLERAPMIRDQVTRFEPVEQLERIIGTQMTASKPGFPPRCVTDGEKRDVEAALIPVNDVGNDTMRIRRQGSIAGKEARFIAGVEQIHVGRTAPPIKGVATTLVACACGMNDDITNSNLAIGWQRSGVRVSEPNQPCGDRWRGEEWDLARELIQRPEGEVIRMCMRQ